MTSRLILLLVLVPLVGCASSPRALGLTGAQPWIPPRAPDDSTVGLPGLPEPGGAAPSGFGTITPATGARYYGTP